MISVTWCFVRSRPRHSVSRRSTSSRFDSSTMSMKSITTMPPRSRRPQLADDLLGRLQVVAGDRLLEVAAGAGVLAGVDVHHVSSPRSGRSPATAGGQEHLAIETLEDLLVDPVRREDVGASGVPAEPARPDRVSTCEGSLSTSSYASLPSTITSRKSSLNRSRTTRMTRSGSADSCTGASCRRHLRLDVVPLSLQTRDVTGQFVDGGAFGRRTDDDAGAFAERAS